jgi:hypothetical protein
MNQGTKRKMDCMSDSVYQMSRDELIDLVNELRCKVIELEKEAKKRKTNVSQSSSKPPTEKELAKLRESLSKKINSAIKKAKFGTHNAKPKVQV